ncbi:MAG: prephenate dehydrogenase [Pirellulales bacterium]|nr:prephenate dehydrogenase [Pirellulales bacterium]
MKPLKTVAIVGVGLIGGSIGCALRQRGLAERVVGIGRHQDSLRTARRVGAVTNTTVDMAKGVGRADLVVVCTPVGRIVDDVRLAAEHCPEGTLLTDAGSTKQAIVEALDEGLPRGCRFLGAHPMAGGEKMGPAHASTDLFEGRVTILTPTKNTRASDFDRLEQLWTALGSMVVQMPADEHDRAVALTSHLPHAVAAALALSAPEKYFRVAGAGLADTTRVAAGRAETWTPVFQTNRDNVLAAMDVFRRNLDALVEAIASGNGDSLNRILVAAKKNRDALGS